MTSALGNIMFLLLFCFICCLFNRYKTRDAFMLKVMSKQNFTQYPYIVSQLKEVEAMFDEIQSLHRYALKKNSMVSHYVVFCAAVLARCWLKSGSLSKQYVT